MTAKKEANRIGNLFYDGSVFDYDKEGHLKEVKKAKERALISVDNSIKSIIKFKHPSNSLAMNRRVDRELKRLKEVKDEINKL
jgi:phage baseplate assembly protein gpV